MVQGFFGSLELLPSWSGIDPDIELFGSGIVKEEEEHQLASFDQGDLPVYLCVCGFLASRSMPT